jgi:amino acid transporter
MTITLFVTLLAILAIAVSLLTEAVKKFFEGSKFTYPANLVSLILSVVVGIGGTATAYVTLNIAFTPPNILCMVSMAVAVWVGSMIGYDKVIQMVEQFRNLKK